MSDDQHCYRVWLRTRRAGRLMTWCPVVVAGSPDEAQAKAVVIYEVVELVQVDHLHACKDVHRAAPRSRKD